MTIICGQVIDEQLIYDQLTSGELTCDELTSLYANSLGHLVVTKTLSDIQMEFGKRFCCTSIFDFNAFRFLLKNVFI